MAKQKRPDKEIRDTMRDTTYGAGEAAVRSGIGGKAGGGMGGQQAGGIKGGGKRKTHVGDKKGSPGGLTSDWKPVGAARDNPYSCPRSDGSGATALLTRYCIAVSLSIADAAASLGMKSMTQRAGEPHSVFSGSHPSEGVKALWAFHSLILAQLFSLVSIFSWLLLGIQSDSIEFILTLARASLKIIYS
jgi:hypothetical protein